MPDPEIKGRKRRACDQCASSKRACDFSLPCETCTAKGLTCSNRRTAERKLSEVGHDANTGSESQIGIHHGTSISLDFWDCSAGTRAETQSVTNTLLQIPSPTMTAISTSCLTDANGFYDDPTSQSIFGSESFDFLLNFELKGGIDRAFNFATSLEQFCQKYDLSLPFSLTDEGHLAVFAHTRIQEPKRSESLLPTVQWLFDPLLPQTKAILEILLEESPRRDAEEADGDEHGDRLLLLSNQCIRLFNPPSLRRFISLYWTKWHWHCPIIHQPSVDIAQMPTAMVIVMGLIGASMSSDREDIDEVRRWLDPTEKAIFAMPWLSRENYVNQRQPLSRESKLRCLQMGHLICALQIWEGNDLARKRVIELRYPQLVQASREVGESHIDLLDEDDDARKAELWSKFILEEEIIRTRIFIFLLDTAFTIFADEPPHATIPDLRFPFPYPDVCFRSHSLNEFLHTSRLHCENYSVLRRMHICDTVKMLYDAGVEGNVTPLLAMTDLNIFVLISALHSIMFSQIITPLKSSVLTTSLNQGLERWLWLWKQGQSYPHPPTGINTSGDEAPTAPSFVRHSYEWYSLAKVKLKLVTHFEAKGRCIQRYASDKSSVRDLILTAQSLNLLGGNYLTV
ncbi:hypothetical protein FB567DRAFT_129066 [Paraphoma chrysanthemicola]|uniref:Zn(2)-C6 fungal-type domain-containing protein n=1 Tax=Paraphoma chrysanthemicola TaxID=798071 RepID=A0A8K0VVH4_9PLEO|nr:hypothetical protein FB567DRAFT_129066 [Paraphoma chrysanthemicola]